MSDASHLIVRPSNKLTGIGYVMTGNPWQGTRRKLQRIRIVVGLSVKALGSCVGIVDEPLLLAFYSILTNEESYETSWRSAYHRLFMTSGSIKYFMVAKAIYLENIKNIISWNEVDEWIPKMYHTTKLQKPD